MTKMVAHCLVEGGLYIHGSNERAPIRIYADGRVEDDIARKFTGHKVREKLSPRELSQVKIAAAENRLKRHA